MNETMIAYEKYRDFDTRLHLTGKCKKTTITYRNGESIEFHYVQTRVLLFGIPLWTRWVNKKDIIFRKIKEEIYDCDFSR